MKYVPKAITRFGGRSMLKLNAKSPTILVVAGVVGLGATAILAAKATRDIDPILDEHKKGRLTIDESVFVHDRDRQKALLHLYTDTAKDLTRLYGPTIAVGVSSTAAVLWGHKILNGRHAATMAAYGGLLEQFQAYRGRVAQTLGPDVERGIYDGAHGVIELNEKGEEVLVPKFDDNAIPDSYLRPWFTNTNSNWTSDPVYNQAFLRGVQAHLNNMLEARGHVFLNDALDNLGMPRTREGAVSGWLRGEEYGDGYISLGFMEKTIDPQTTAFQNKQVPDVRLNFNIDGTIWDKI